MPSTVASAPPSNEGCGPEVEGNPDPSASLHIATPWRFAFPATSQQGRRHSEHLRAPLSLPPPPPRVRKLHGLSESPTQQASVDEGCRSSHVTQNVRALAMLECHLPPPTSLATRPSPSRFLLAAPGFKSRPTTFQMNLPRDTWQGRRHRQVDFGDVVLDQCKGFED
ncbi:hypothetical protein GALMADRAFT_133796 [Galerina marginata CBS 339.88]|uniref:Uncharacterized protein n=1 Tax=Galerina marginata (strain CBS 339.88) TaxID=685588 RepID=A0A067TMT8_GALM3|nr:hypothetical protein GALMADRAFT_133796 [Galerina marginata CBS 339.88]